MKVKNHNFIHHFWLHIMFLIIDNFSKIIVFLENKLFRSLSGLVNSLATQLIGKGTTTTLFLQLTLNAVRKIDFNFTNFEGIFVNSDGHPLICIIIVTSFQSLIHTSVQELMLCAKIAKTVQKLILLVFIGCNTRISI